MPKFTNKIESAHDYNSIRHLIKSNKKMSQVLWELSLRPDAYKKDGHQIKTADSKISKNTKFFS
jgi:hypothetical protein